MACSVYNKKSCVEVSSIYSKQYPATIFTADRTVFAADTDGFRIAVNSESNTLVSFTGSLTNTEALGERAIDFSNFVVCLRYFNVRLPSYKHVLAKVAVSLPYRPDTLEAPISYFVPITLTGVAPLCSGIFQFDVVVYPLVLGVDPCSTTTCGDEEATIPDLIYTVSGCGSLSIEVTRKNL